MGNNSPNKKQSMILQKPSLMITIPNHTLLYFIHREAQQTEEQKSRLKVTDLRLREIILKIDFGQDLLIQQPKLSWLLQKKSHQISYQLIPGNGQLLPFLLLKMLFFKSH
jgi:hypothetical protein